MEKASTLPAKLEEQVQGSGIELSKAESIASNYAPFLVQISEQAKLLKGLKDDSPEDVATARRVRIDLGKISAPATAQKKADKDLILIETRFIDGLFNTVEGFRKLTIEDAKLIEEAADKIEEARIAELNSKRLAELQKFDVDGTDFNVGAMNDEVYETFLSGTEAKYKARQEADRLAEEERIAKEKAEEQERIRLENIKLKSEADERDRLESVAKENKAKADKLEAENKARIEAEAKTKADALAKEKAAALAPDYDKIISSLNCIIIDNPNFKTLEAKAIWDEILTKLGGFQDWALLQANKLK